MISSEEVQRKWPEMATKYLLNRLKFTMEKRTRYDAAEIVETTDVVVIDKTIEVDRVLGCTDCTDIGGLHFWCQFKNGSRKLVPETVEMRSNYGMRVIQYLEANLLADPASQFSRYYGDSYREYMAMINMANHFYEKKVDFFPVFCSPVTRSKIKQIHSFNLDAGLFVSIARNLTLDHYCLNKSKMPARRHSQSILKVTTSPLAMRRARAKSQTTSSIPMLLQNSPPNSSSQASPATAVSTGNQNGGILSNNSASIATSLAQLSPATQNDGNNSVALALAITATPAIPRRQVPLLLPIQDVLPTTSQNSGNFAPVVRRRSAITQIIMNRVNGPADSTLMNEPSNSTTFQRSKNIPFAITGRRRSSSSFKENQ